MIPVRSLSQSASSKQARNRIPTGPNREELEIGRNSARDWLAQRPKVATSSPNSFMWLLPPCPTGFLTRLLSQVSQWLRASAPFTCIPARKKEKAEGHGIFFSCDLRLFKIQDGNLPQRLCLRLLARNVSHGHSLL